MGGSYKKCNHIELFFIISLGFFTLCLLWKIFWWPRVWWTLSNANHINRLSHSTTFGSHHPLVVVPLLKLCVPKEITRQLLNIPALGGQSWFILGTGWIFMRLETIWYSGSLCGQEMMTSCQRLSCINSDLMRPPSRHKARFSDENHLRCLI